MSKYPKKLEIEIYKRKICQNEIGMILKSLLKIKFTARFLHDKSTFAISIKMVQIIFNTILYHNLLKASSSIVNVFHTFAQFVSMLTENNL